jgi:alanyl-tRNA synthetase
MPTGSEIRRKFLDFFVQKGHKEVHSSSLVPANDPTLLFTNAGMNQFKDVFLGLEKRDYSRATTSQKCVRAGGKHNDLENVGFTNRHHTFFEMLGNFSFGDYFKKDAIAYAWELITSPEWFGIDKDKLYVTIFEGSGEPMPVSRDIEAYDLWVAQGVAKERIFDGGLKDNFWQMGDTGPCGPCSEIHYDMGPAASDQGHTDCKFPCDCGRYVEIWNLVFMQFDRDASGKLNPLPKPSIDTGMGLERVTAVLQGVISNYDTDLFIPLIERAAELTLGVGGKTAELRSAGQPGAAVPTRVEEGTGHVGTAAPGRAAEQSSAGSPNHKSAASLRVIADHSRAATFLISDGVLPSNEGRGYVLRKIIRRAITHGRLLGQTKPFLHEMVKAVCELMKDAYPELKETADRVSKMIMSEEMKFVHALEIGLRELEKDLELIEDSGRLYRQGNVLFQSVTDWFPFPKSIELDGDTLDVRQPGSKGHRISHLEKAELLELDERKYVSVFGDSVNILHDSHKPLTLPKGVYEVILQREYEPAKIPPPRYVYSGEKAFRLYDTFGMPLDFIQDAARDQGIEFDQAGFDRAMEEQKTRARASWKGAAKQTANPAYQQLPKSVFEGYRQTHSENCEVLAIIKNGQGAQELKAGESGEVILDHTPFYADSGGQVGDLGWLTDPKDPGAFQLGVFQTSAFHTARTVAEVTGCYSPIQGVRAHQVVAKASIRIGDKVDAVVNADIRESTMRNHTATHLLHAGLREVLGKHVKQAGSLVAPDHLRFDFSHFTAVEDEELQDIEDIINKEVLRNQIVETITDVPIDEAINTYHAMALFGEKYGDKVRVVRIGDFSTELCGGTHTGATGEIGLIKILKEGSVSSGVRRVEAVTGEGSLNRFRSALHLENAAAHLTGISGELTDVTQSLSDAVTKKDSEIKRLTRELDSVRMKSASSSTANIGDQIKDIKGVKVLAHRVDNLERAQMRTLVDQLRDKIGSGVVVLGSASNGNVSLIVGVTKDLINKVQAGKVIGPVAQKVGGKGGGRPDLAEAGGKDPAALDSALDGAYAVVESLLA